MSILSKVNLAGLTILSPADALKVLAVRGEWSELARAVQSQLNGTVAGSVVRFDSIGLSPDDFKRTTKTATRSVGEIDYSGITTAARAYGLLVKRLTDESRGFYVPANADEIIARVKSQRVKAAAKAKTKTTK